VGLGFDSEDEDEDEGEGEGAGCKVNARLRLVSRVARCGKLYDIICVFKLPLPCGLHLQCGLQLRNKGHKGRYVHMHTCCHVPGVHLRRTTRGLFLVGLFVVVILGVTAPQQSSMLGRAREPQTAKLMLLRLLRLGSAAGFFSHLCWFLLRLARPPCGPQRYRARLPLSFRTLLVGLRIFRYCGWW
jgi:hypothetical protein